MDAQLIEIVTTLIAALRAGPQDLTWQSTYLDEAEVVADLRDHLDRLRAGDRSRLPELRFALLPTGPLQEIAVSSGWGDTYVRLANRFDTLRPGEGETAGPDDRTVTDTP